MISIQLESESASYYFTMNLIKDRMLYSSESRLEVTFKERFVHRLIKTIRRELGEKGDRDWMIDTDTGATIKERIYFCEYRTIISKPPPPIVTLTRPIL